MVGDFDPNTRPMIANCHDTSVFLLTGGSCSIITWGIIALIWGACQ